MPQLARAWALLRADPARTCLAALVLADLVLVWSLPLLTGQDLPQHLSYARILADYGDPSLPFRDAFVLPSHPQPYFTAYLLLVPLTRLTSVLTACRLVYSGYIVATAAAFLSLVNAVHAGRGGTSARETPWTALFGALLPWNPVQCVGFLPFMLALPAIVWGAAALVRFGEARSQPAARHAEILGAAAVATSLHLVAIAALVAFGAVYALARRTRRAFGGAILMLAGAAATLGLWHTLGERGLAELPSAMIADAVRREGLYAGLVDAFGVQWSPALTKWSFVVATLLGPLVAGAKLTVAVAAVVAAVVLWSGRRHVTSPVPAAQTGAFGYATLACALAVVVTPAAIRVPDDICLLDFRLYVVAFMLGAACLRPGWFEPLRGRVALTAFAGLVIAIWARQLHGVAGEAGDVVALVERLDPKGTLLALPFHDRSEFLDEDNSVTHYFPVYFTALRGGVSSLFWGKFSHHLPVGYRDGHEPERPPDWDPGRFTRRELVGVTTVLVEWPDADDGDERAAAAARLRRELADGFEPEGCSGRWCLYAAPHRSEPAEGNVTESEEARR